MWFKKIMAVKLIKGIKITAFIKGMWFRKTQIQQQTNTLYFCFLIQQISVLCFFDGYIYFYWTIQNVMTVRYAPIIVHLKIPPYPTHSDYYSLAIKFFILSLSKFY